MLHTVQVAQVVHILARISLLNISDDGDDFIAYYGCALDSSATWPAGLLPPKYPIDDEETTIVLYANLPGEDDDCEEDDTDVDPRDGSEVDDDIDVLACTCNNNVLCNGAHSVSGFSAVTIVLFASLLSVKY